MTDIIMLFTFFVLPKASWELVGAGLRFLCFMEIPLPIHELEKVFS